MENRYYHSTRGSGKLSPKEAVLRGIADDGGLYVWDGLEDVRLDLDALLKLDYQEMAKRLFAEVLWDYSEEELARLYQTCKVAVVPLRYGAGVKGKVVEAVYNGIPVVTTSTGAEGIPLAGTVMEIEDQPRDFADKVVRLYCDNQRCQSMCRRTQEYIKHNYSMDGAWRIIEEDFRQV